IMVIDIGHGPDEPAGLPFAEPGYLDRRQVAGLDRFSKPSVWHAVLVARWRTGGVCGFATQVDRLALDPDRVAVMHAGPHCVRQVQPAARRLTLHRRGTAVFDYGICEGRIVYIHDDYAVAGQERDV